MPALGLTTTLVFTAGQLRANLSSGTVGGASGTPTWEMLIRPKGGSKWTSMPAKLVGTVLAVAEPLKPYIQDVMIRAVDAVGAAYDSAILTFDPVALAVQDFPVLDFPRKIGIGVNGNALAYTVDNDGVSWNAPSVYGQTLLGIGTTTLTKTTLNGISNIAFSTVAPLGDFFYGTAGGGF